MRFHHVNLAVPPERFDDEIAFLVEGLGLRRVAPPPELADRANWFELPDGVQVHLSRDPGFAPSDRAHVALDLGADERPALEARLAARGVEVTQVFTGASVLVDPSGNRWELR